MKYTTSYTSSNGQFSNGFQIHETLNAALSAWEANIGSLIHRSGGDSTLHAWEDADSDTVEPIGSISWIEHCEGGFAYGEGIFSDEVSHLAKYKEENGEMLTAEKLVRYLSE